MQIVISKTIINLQSLNIKSNVLILYASRAQEKREQWKGEKVAPKSKKKTQSKLRAWVQYNDSYVH